MTWPFAEPLLARALWGTAIFCATAGPVTAQCTAKLVYSGAPVGTADTLAPGEDVATQGILVTIATGIYSQATLSVTKVVFKGRTGENTYAFTIAREERRSTTRDPEARVVVSPPEEVVLWWERLDQSHTVGPVEFSIEPHGGTPVLHIRKHPDPYEGACPRRR